MSTRYYTRRSTLLDLEIMLIKLKLQKRLFLTQEIRNFLNRIEGIVDE